MHHPSGQSANAADRLENCGGAPSPSPLEPCSRIPRREVDVEHLDLLFRFISGIEERERHVRDDDMSAGEGLARRWVARRAGSD